MKKLVAVVLGFGLWSSFVAAAEETPKFVLIKFKTKLAQNVQVEHIEKLKTLNSPTTQLLDLPEQQDLSFQIADVVLVSTKDIKIKIQILLPDADVESILTFDPHAVDFVPKNDRSAAKIFQVFDDLLKNDDPALLAENIVTVAQNIDVLQHLHGDQKQKLMRGLNRAMSQMLHLYLLSVNGGANHLQSPLLELSKLSHFSLNRLQSQVAVSSCAQQLSASL
jgi:hypothetical protein